MSGSGKREVKGNPNYPEQPGLSRPRTGWSQSVAEVNAVAGGEGDGWGEDVG